MFTFKTPWLEVLEVKLKESWFYSEHRKNLFQGNEIKTGGIFRNVTNQNIFFVSSPSLKKYSKALYDLKFFRTFWWDGRGGGGFLTFSILNFYVSKEYVHQMQHINTKLKNTQILYPFFYWGTQMQHRYM